MATLSDPNSVNFSLNQFLERVYNHEQITLTEFDSLKRKYDELTAEVQALRNADSIGEIQSLKEAIQMMERNEKILLDQVTASDAKLENFRQGLANNGTPQIVNRKTPKPTRLEGKRGEAEQYLREVVNYVGGESDQNKDELCRIASAYFGPLLILERLLMICSMVCTQLTKSYFGLTGQP